MTLPDQLTLQETGRPAKRDIQKISGCADDLSPASKRHAGDPASPDLPTRTLKALCGPAQSSDETERKIADTTYDYPGLEEDMSSIFDHNSSLHCSDGKHWDADISIDLDSISWKDWRSASVEAFPIETSKLDGRVVPGTNDPDKTKLAFQQLPQLNRQPSGTGFVQNKHDFFDEEIDWDEALMSPSPSVGGSPTVNVSPCQDLDVVPVPADVPTPSVQQTQPLLLRPYKTFFHISDMLFHKAELYKNQPAAIFELFARVIYTNRDRGVRGQFFQLCDIMAQNPPYLSGSLLS